MTSLKKIQEVKTAMEQIERNNQRLLETTTPSRTELAFLLWQHRNAQMRNFYRNNPLAGRDPNVYNAVIEQFKKREIRAKRHFCLRNGSPMRCMYWNERQSRAFDMWLEVSNKTRALKLFLFTHESRFIHASQLDAALQVVRWQNLMYRLEQEAWDVYPDSKPIINLPKEFAE